MKVLARFNCAGRGSRAGKKSKLRAVLGKSQFIYKAVDLAPRTKQDSLSWWSSGGRKKRVLVGEAGCASL